MVNGDSPTVRLVISDHKEIEVIESETYRLGKGGYGTVFKGRNVNEGTDVAVKKVEINKKTTKYVTREKDFMEKCNYRHIVQIFAAMRLGSFMYFILEYCIQGSLNQFYHKQEDRISFEQCLKFMKDIAHGIRYLHCTVKICHRDVTPANILVQNDTDGSGVYMKVGDFGLARDFPESASAFSVSGNVGTAGWRAPEIPQCSGKSYDYRFPVDIFSLGLLFLSMLKHQPGHFLQPHQGISLFTVSLCLNTVNFA